MRRKSLRSFCKQREVLSSPELCPQARTSDPLHVKMIRVDAIKQRRLRDCEAVCGVARRLATRCGPSVVWLFSKRYSVTARPTGSESAVALPAIVWIGATLPLAAAAKTRIAFDAGFETKMSTLVLLTA